MKLTIKIHQAPRQADEVFAAALFLLKRGLRLEDVEFEEVPHSTKAVADPGKVVWIDCGGIYDPNFGCYDHHGDAALHSSFYLIAKEFEPSLIGSTLMTRVDTWDTQGFVGAAKALGYRQPSDVNEFPFDQVERYLIRQFERKNYGVLQIFMDTLEYYISARRLKLDRITLLRDNTEVIEIQKPYMIGSPILEDELQRGVIDHKLRILFLPTALGDSQIVGLSDIAWENKCHLKLAPNMSDPRRWSLIRTNRGRLHGINLAHIVVQGSDLFTYAHTSGQLATTNIGIAPKRILKLLDTLDIGFRVRVVSDVPVPAEEEDPPTEPEEATPAAPRVQLSAEDEELFQGMTQGRIPGSGGR